ncbi:hypothetical protein ACFL1H_02135 [Nanoarchaeota archaeon]
MAIWLVQILPKQIILLLGPISLILVGYIAEKYYIGRITLFANAMALITFFAFIEIIPWIIVLYINVATIIGIIGLASYAFKYKLAQEFYTFGTIFSSVITGGILLYGLFLI